MCPHIPKLIDTCVDNDLSNRFFLNYYLNTGVKLIPDYDHP